MKRIVTSKNSLIIIFTVSLLFLKHNLNAQAIASLQDELGTLEAEIGVLISDMEKSIKQADVFIQQMNIQES